MIKGKPAIVSSENELFAKVRSTRESASELAPKRSAFRYVKSLIPARSLNLSRERLFVRIDKSIEGQKLQILVLGCGNQVDQIARIFSGEYCTFVFTDIGLDADADIYCDAHELPFLSGSFDGVISTAVIEHVLLPELVMEEVARVVKSGGFIYSEAPFLQSVHEGAYDFTRYSMSGHRRLLSHFEETDSGMVAGPGTAFLWSVTDLVRTILPAGKFSRAGFLVARLLFFWVKHIDRFLENSPRALDYASCTYFYGKKQSKVTSAAEIVQRYGR